MTSIVLCAWLGGLEEYKSETATSTSFLTIEEVGRFLDSRTPSSPFYTFSQRLISAVPVNLKEQDAFHLTIEEYLLSLISMAEELVTNHPCPPFVYLSRCTNGLTLIVPSGRQLRHAGRLHAPRADRKFRQGFVCRIPASESEE